MATLLTPRDVSQISDELAGLRKEVRSLAKSTKSAVDGWGVPHDGEVGCEGAAPSLLRQAMRMKELQRILETATLVSMPMTADEVQLGTKVTILRNGEKQVWKIGGLSDPGKGRMAYHAPLAESLLGKRVGEEFFFRVVYGGSSVRVKIVCLEVDDEN